MKPKISLDNKTCQVYESIIPEGTEVRTQARLTKSLEPISFDKELELLETQPKAKSVDHIHFMEEKQLDVTNAWL